MIPSTNMTEYIGNHRKKATAYDAVGSEGMTEAAGV